VEVVTGSLNGMSTTELTAMLKMEFFIFNHHSLKML